MNTAGFVVWQVKEEVPLFSFAHRTRCSRWSIRSLGQQPCLVWSVKGARRRLASLVRNKKVTVREGDKYVRPSSLLPAPEEQVEQARVAIAIWRGRGRSPESIRISACQGEGVREAAADISSHACTRRTPLRQCSRLHQQNATRSPPGVV